MLHSFAEKLEFGKQAEIAVSDWLKRRGWYVVPSYDYNGDDNKAPRLAGLFSTFVVPDLDVSKDGTRLWVEVKRYCDSPVNRKLGERVHGIKERLYKEYLMVQRVSGTPAYLMVVEDFEGGSVLCQRLDTMEPHACQCGSCRSGQPYHCRAPIKASVYFRRSEFIECGTTAELVGGLEGAA